MRSVRLASTATFVFALALGWGRASAAEWRLVEVSGQVRIAAPGRQAASGAANQEVPVGSTVTTAGGARAALYNGAQRITLGPNSRMTVAPETAGGMVRIMEDLGSILFQVDKRPVQHFRVETPLLAAIVKGTTFTVNIEPTADTVHVAEGLVEVRANNGGAAKDVPAGSTGMVPRQAPAQVTVTAPTAQAAPVPLSDVSVLDYKKVSKGLVDGPAATFATAAAAAQPRGAVSPAQGGAASSGPSQQTDFGPAANVTASLAVRPPAGPANGGAVAGLAHTPAGAPTPASVQTAQGQAGANSNGAGAPPSSPPGQSNDHAGGPPATPPGQANGNANGASGAGGPPSAPPGQANGAGNGGGNAAGGPPSTPPRQGNGNGNGGGGTPSTPPGQANGNGNGNGAGASTGPTVTSPSSNPPGQANGNGNGNGSGGSTGPTVTSPSPASSGGGNGNGGHAGGGSTSPTVSSPSPASGGGNGNGGAGGSTSPTVTSPPPSSNGPSGNGNGNGNGGSTTPTVTSPTPSSGGGGNGGAPGGGSKNGKGGG